MNIIFPTTKNRRLIGIADGFIEAKIPLIKWDFNRKSPFDLFDEYCPSLLFFAEAETTPQLSQALSQCLNEYKSTKLVWIGDSFPPEIKPDLVCNVNKKAKGDYHLTQGVNAYTLGNGQSVKNYEVDILILSYRKFEAFETQILLSCIYPNSNYSYRIIGPQKISLPQYVGDVDLQTMTNMIASSKVCLDAYGDYIYDIAYNKTLPITTIENELVTPIKSIVDMKRYLKFVITKDDIVRTDEIVRVVHLACKNKYSDKAYEIVKLLKEPVLIGKFDEARNIHK